MVVRDGWGRSAERVAAPRRALVGERPTCALHRRPRRAAQVVEITIAGDRHRVALCAGHLREFRAALGGWQPAG